MILFFLNHVHSHPTHISLAFGLDCYAHSPGVPSLDWDPIMHKKVTLSGYSLRPQGFPTCVGTQLCALKKKQLDELLFCAPTWARTRDQKIMSLLL